MNEHETTLNERHIGSYLIAIGSVFLFVGSGAALGIADNYLFFLLAIITNIFEALQQKKSKIHLNIINTFFILVVVLTVFFMVSGKYDRGSALSVIMFAALFLSIDFDNFNSNDAIVIINGVIISSIIFSLLILLQGHEFLYRGTAKYTYTQTFGSKITFEPNYLGTIISMGVCLSIVLLVNYSTDKKKALIYVATAIISLVGVMLTGSRSAFVSVTIFGLMLVATMKRSKTKKRIILIIVLLFTLIFLLIALGVIPETIYQRMLASSYVDGSNKKRITDWSYGLKALINNPIVGNGPQPTLNIIMSQFSFHGDVHNTFLTFGVMFGVVPFILFIIWTINITARLFKERQRLLFSALVAMIFEWNILACQFTVSMWLMLIICVASTSNSSYIARRQFRM